jgi:hypothetical protein
MRTDSSPNNDLAGVFAMAEGSPVDAASPELLSAITSSGRRRRRNHQLAIAGPLAVVSAGVIIGGVALAGGSSHQVSHLVIKPAASSKPAAKKQAVAAAPCDVAGAQHYLVAAEIPANLGDRKDAEPTAAVPLEISWPGTTAADPNFDFKVACASGVTGSGTPVDVNGVPGTLSHTNTAGTGPDSTISWSPAAGYVVSYSSWGGSNGPVSDTALIAMARAVPSAP